MIFPVHIYGYPRAEGYSYATDLVLLQTAQASGYTRQRRTYMHNASKYTLSFRVSTLQAMSLRKWLQENNDWFTMQLLGGNDASQVLDIYETEVRRTSTIESTRTPMLDQFTVSFEVETRAMTDYQTAATAAAGLALQDYPSNLPMPSMYAFTSSHGERNVTAYSLVYRMNTSMLKEWQLFAAFIGTAWFRTFMVSSNVYGDNEVVRYNSSPSMTLVAPNIWEVSIGVQTLPELLINTEDTLVAIGECAYNSDITYDYPLEEYDCAGDIGPPTGNFVTPAGVFNVTSSSSGLAPQTAESVVKFGRDGSVSSTPTGSPAWTEWHTEAFSLPAAAIAFDVAVEASNNGVTWNEYTPSAEGKYINLQSNDVYIRRKRNSSISSNESYPVTVTFQSDKQTDQMDSSVVTVSLNTNISVSTPVNNIVPNFQFEEFMQGLGDPDVPPDDWQVGVIVKPNGSTTSINTNASDGDWALPYTAGYGAGKWLIATQTSGESALGNAGVRISMSSDITFILVGIGFRSVEWDGTIEIYDAASGGTLLGQGNMYIYGELVNPLAP